MAERTFADYVEHLNNAGKSAAAETYYYVMKGYAARKGKGVEELTWEDFKPTDVREHMARLSPRTANTLLAAARGFLRYLKEDALDIEEYNRYAMMYDRLGQIEPKKIPKSLYKKSLNIQQLREILNDLTGYLYDATVVIFYLGSRPVELSYEFRQGEIDLEKLTDRNREPERIVDFDNRLIAIITAKTKAERIIPIDERVLPHFERFFEGHDEILSYFRPREWFTRRLASVKGIHITAKTARYTLTTLMSERVPNELFVKYWVGHTTDITDVYRDYIELLDDLKREFVPKHYIFEVLDGGGKHDR